MERIVSDIQKNRGKIIYTTYTTYHLLLALTLICMSNRTDDAIIIMTSFDKNDIRIFCSISKRMSKYGIRSVVIDKRTIFHRLIGLSWLENTLIYKRICNEARIENDDFLLVNFSWAMKRVFYPASYYFKKCRNTIFVQDGVLQYVVPENSEVKLFIQKIFGSVIDYWKYDKLKSIYVEHPDRFPEYLQEKIKKFVFSEKALLTEQKECIKDILLDADSKEELGYLADAKGIIFTQPFVGDGFLSKEENAEIFKKLTEFYMRYGKVVLKIHPRDNEDYTYLGIPIIKGKYPSEMYALDNIKFEFAVGICTSAIWTIDAKRKIMLNENFLKDKEFELMDLEEKS